MFKAFRRVYLAETCLVVLVTVQAEFDVNCNVVTVGNPLPKGDEVPKRLGPYKMQPDQNHTEWQVPRGVCKAGFHHTAWTVSACDTNLKGPTLEITQFSAVIHRRPPHPGTAVYYIDVYCNPREKKE